MIEGLPSINFLAVSLFNITTDKSVSKNKRVIIGIMPLIKGMSEFSIGVAANSAIIIVITNSKGCNSPICLLPINLTTIKTKAYNITDLIKKTNILVFPFTFFISTYSNFFLILYISHYYFYLCKTFEQSFIS